MAYRKWGPKVPIRRLGPKTTMKAETTAALPPDTSRADGDTDPKITPILRSYGKALANEMDDMPLDTWARLRSRLDE